MYLHGSTAGLSIRLHRWLIHSPPPRCICIHLSYSLAPSLILSQSSLTGGLRVGGAKREPSQPSRPLSSSPSSQWFAICPFLLHLSFSSPSICICTSPICAKRQREQDAELPREKSKQAGQRAQQSPQGRGRHDVEHRLRPQRVPGNDDGGYLLRVLLMLPAAADAPAPSPQTQP